MLSKEQIDKILDNARQIPENLKKCEEALAAGDIDEALKILEADKTFRAYFFAIVKKADFGVDISVPDVNVIAHLLGVETFSLIVNSYGVFSKAPKVWKILEINALGLAEFNARMLCDWIKILKHIRKKNARNLSLVPFMLLNFIICELVFANLSNLDEIIKKTDLSYDRILKNIYGAGLFESVCKMAGWDLARISVIDKRIIGYMQLLLVYEINQPHFRTFGFEKVLNLQSLASYEMTMDFKRLFA